MTLTPFRSVFAGLRSAATVAVALACSIGFGRLAIAEGLDPAKLPGIVVDDGAAEALGTWTNSTHTRPFVGAGYIYSAGGESNLVKFPIEVKEAGTYSVLLAYSPGANRTDRAPVQIHAADGQHSAIVDQQKVPVGVGPFHLLGQYDFTAGTTEIIVSAEANEKGVVIADAVMLVSKESLEKFKADYAKEFPKLVTKKADKPAKPVAGAKAKPAEPPLETAPAFVRVPATKQREKLTPHSLDALMEKHVGGIESATIVGDEAFLRRICFDLCGRQPTSDEMATFLADTMPDKRERAVDRYLALPEFGRNWGNYFSDVVSYRTPEPELTFLNYTPFKGWLAEQLNQDVGYDEVAYRIITASGKVADNPAASYVGFHQGDRSRLAAETTRIFLSTQIQCAECHDHKFIDMPQETFHHVAAFFVRVQAKLPWNDSSQILVSSKAAGEHKMPEGREEMKPMAFSEKSLELGRSDIDRRVELANWIVGSENPWFAKAFTNRVWARMMGRGFCEPVDEIGELGDRVLPEVHAAVADHFIATGFKAKDLFRTIALSKSYQRGICDPAKGDEKPFATIAAGRLRGDEVFDSLAVAISLPDVTPPAMAPTAEIRFPPPPKSTRDLVNEAFGFDPSSEAVHVLRTMQQAMFLMNNDQIQKQIDASPGSGTVLAQLLAAEASNDVVVEKLYERVLARKPTAKEIEIAREHIASIADRGDAFEDLLWSMINSAEFLSRR
ncbi:protein of unknown function DUF1549 [Pirellula staleyi DSM 6068]|uniref:Xanthan lyase n=1 Tax=Pirellula staleyi (strain ATCC 27377 / DSM 6068 / ICPB 4128) TaxID=530564 RepID=D2R4I8_PIRSD|nr:DUF1549 domain-containing protein [Pirellula staleyi]ADB17054.1 protein of unknown function DUF1549 [Pirellula staleyi DSM 6068]